MRAWMRSINLAKPSAAGKCYAHKLKTKNMSTSLAVTGIAPRGTRGKASQVITGVVPALGTLPMRVSGSAYYMIQTSAALQLRPSGGGQVGFFDAHTTGTGKELGDLNAFDMVEVQNLNNFAVVFQLFVGWDGFIDKRLILANQNTPQVVFPTYKTASSATVVNINDLSGTQFTDVNGGKWYALYRVAILIFNPDTGVTLLVQKAGSIIAADFAVGVVYPQTSLRLDIAGNYCLNLGGATINAIVSEIYASLPSPT